MSVSAAGRGGPPALMGLAAGAVVALVLLPFATLDAPPFQFSAANIALAAFPALFLLRARGGAWRMAYFATCGCALAGLVYLILDPHRFGPTALVGGLVAVALYAAAATLSREQGFSVFRSDCLIAAASAALTVVAYRVFALSTADVPNEDRSLIIAGHEIHHLNVGLVGALVLSLLAPPRAIVGRTLYFILAGSALGGVIDQTSYFFFAHLGDAEYYSAISLAGPIAQLLAFAAIAVFMGPRCAAEP